MVGEISFQWITIHWFTSPKLIASVNVEDILESLPVPIWCLWEVIFKVLPRKFSVSPNYSRLDCSINIYLGCFHSVKLRKACDCCRKRCIIQDLEFFLTFWSLMKVSSFMTILSATTIKTFFSSIRTLQVQRILKNLNYILQ